MHADLDPPQQISAGGGGLAPHPPTGEVPVGQQQHPRPERGQYLPGQRLLRTGAERRVDHGVCTDLNQGQ